jgi:hypothetical protein
VRDTLLRAAAAEGAEGPPPSVRDDDLRIRDDDAQEWGRATGGGRAVAGVDVTQKKKWKEGIAAERKGVFLYWADKALNKEV